ncbi:hypothetical protein SPLC1_S260340 [Arthrospira platensis C1]|nr:hypothetical protein SPLC1_S260340 [Arthrospira platensis C1]
MTPTPELETGFLNPNFATETPDEPRNPVSFPRSNSHSPFYTTRISIALNDDGGTVG